MKSFGIGLAIAFAAMATSAAAQDVQVHSVQPDTQPDWLQKPNLDQYVAVYPKVATEKGVSGLAQIRCTVNLQGLMRGCRVLQETPAGMGFGNAALSLAPTILMKPGTHNGHPVESEVTIPLNFKTEGAYKNPNAQTVMVLPEMIWLKTPSVAEILAEINKKVGDKFAEGKVVFQCDVDKKLGDIHDCAVLNTAPGMVQFTGVARSLTKKFKADPTVLASFKDKVKLNIAFSFPDMQSDAWSARYLSHPNWIRTVSPDPNLPLFPDAAAAAGLKEGSATVDCVVNPTGALTNCTTISESAPNVGFGDMAQRIAEAFVANPWTEDGLPADGAHIRFPIRMKYDPSLAKADPLPAPAAKP